MRASDSSTMFLLPQSGRKSSSSKVKPQVGGVKKVRNVPRPNGLKFRSEAERFGFHQFNKKLLAVRHQLSPAGKIIARRPRRGKNVVTRRAPPPSRRCKSEARAAADNMKKADVFHDDREESLKVAVGDTDTERSCDDPMDISYEEPPEAVVIYIESSDEEVDVKPKPDLTPSYGTTSGPGIRRRRVAIDETTDEESGDDNSEDEAPAPKVPEKIDDDDSPLYTKLFPFPSARREDEVKIIKIEKVSSEWMDSDIPVDTGKVTRTSWLQPTGIKIEKEYPNNGCMTLYGCSPLRAAPKLIPVDGNTPPRGGNKPQYGVPDMPEDEYFFHPSNPYTISGSMPDDDPMMPALELVRDTGTVTSGRAASTSTGVTTMSSGSSKRRLFSPDMPTMEPARALKESSSVRFGCDGDAATDDIMAGLGLADGITPKTSSLSNTMGKQMSRNMKPVIAKATASPRKCPHPSRQEVNQDILLVSCSGFYSEGNQAARRAGEGQAIMRYNDYVRETQCEVQSPSHLQRQKEFVQQIGEEIGKEVVFQGLWDPKTFPNCLIDVIYFEVATTADGTSGAFFELQGNVDFLRDVFSIPAGQAGSVLHTGSTVILDDLHRFSIVRGIMKEHIRRIIDRINDHGVQVESVTIPEHKLRALFPNQRT